MSYAEDESMSLLGPHPEDNDTDHLVDSSDGGATGGAAPRSALEFCRARQLGRPAARRAPPLVAGAAALLGACALWRLQGGAQEASKSTLRTGASPGDDLVGLHESSGHHLSDDGRRRHLTAPLHEGRLVDESGLVVGYPMKSTVLDSEEVQAAVESLNAGAVEVVEGESGAAAESDSESDDDSEELEDTGALEDKADPADPADPAAPDGERQEGDPELCSQTGCGGPFMPERKCQCNLGCKDFKDCCADYEEECAAGEHSHHHHDAPPPPPPSECTPKVEGQCELPRIMAHLGASEPLACVCPPPLVPHKNDSCNECLPAEGPLQMTFYMYRAQGDDSYPIENVNMADLAGVMWYLQREVVGSTPRKFHIKRIMRYSVSMKVTQDYFDQHPKHFGPFVAYDAGSAKGRSEQFDKYGYVVGCQLLDTKLFNYVPPPSVQPACHPQSSMMCNSPKWYSLPGPCPEYDHEEKLANPSCAASAPGGACPSAVVTGEHDCTYFAAPAGEISLDELVGIEDYDMFWQSRNSKGDILPNGNVEYVRHLDAGIGIDFWDGGHDKDNCTKRMEKVTKLFKAKYPDLPETLPEPPCN